MNLNAQTRPKLLKVKTHLKAGANCWYALNEFLKNTTWDNRNKLLNCCSNDNYCLNPSTRYS
jgi:hypothetical protein